MPDCLKSRNAKVKTDMPEKTKNSWNPWSQSGGWKARKNYGGKDLSVASLRLVSPRVATNGVTYSLLKKLTIFLFIVLCKVI